MSELTIIEDDREAIFQRFAESPPDLTGAIAAVDCQQHRPIANGFVVQICAMNFEGRHGGKSMQRVFFEFGCLLLRCVHEHETVVI